ncbi:carboxypeptidase-like regulatory domain-containing protein [Pedobacter sp.]|uniref:carboxypeptidase-like regulatory domain-containing protein n=1 Tax=Pedobacter sp. TaxID=1411316 RepID=UPI0031CEC2CA
MKQLTICIFFLWSALFISCKKGNNTDKPSTKQYTISGTVKDAAGNPVQNARIRVENPNGNNIHYTATSNEVGKYSIAVSAIGGYKIYAWKETTFENQTYQIRLGMEKDTDYDAFSVPPSGVTKNFVWKLTGRIPDRVASKENGTGYFGGTIKFINYNSFVEQMPAGTEVAITLTPLANTKFIDGTPANGKILVRKFAIINGVGQAYYLNDIPAAKYRITASASLNGVVRYADIGSGNPNELTISAEHYFKAEAGAGSYESGLASPNEYPFYLAVWWD